MYAIHVYTPAGVMLRAFSFVQAARYRLGENEVGEFELTVPWDETQIPIVLVPPNRVEFWRDGVYVFGGVIRRQGATQDGRVPMYTVSGPSYMQWLADARVTSVAGTADVVFASGHLDDVMKTVVRNHVTDISTDFVVAADTGSSTKVDTYTATGYSTVLETLQGIATNAGDTSFDIVRDTDGALRFKTWSPSRGPDRSRGTPSPTLFDLRGGNLLSAEWTRDGNNVVNALRGGGPNDKAARYVYPSTEYYTDAQSIADWGRIEGFIDAGNETTIATDKKVREELLKQALPEESVSFKVGPAGRYKLGQHFDFGTKVTVVWEPILEFTDTIRGIEVQLDTGSNVAQVDINVGDTVTGDSTTRASIYLGRFLRRLRRDISIQTRH